jgi:hypothetical protein
MKKIVTNILTRSTIWWITSSLASALNETAFIHQGKPDLFPFPILRQGTYGGIHSVEFGPNWCSATKSQDENIQFPKRVLSEKVNYGQKSKKSCPVFHRTELVYCEWTMHLIICKVWLMKPKFILQDLPVKACFSSFLCFSLFCRPLTLIIWEQGILDPCNMANEF